MKHLRIEVDSFSDFRQNKQIGSVQWKLCLYYWHDLFFISHLRKHGSLLQHVGARGLRKADISGRLAPSWAFLFILIIRLQFSSHNRQFAHFSLGLRLLMLLCYYVYLLQSVPNAVP